MRTQKRNRARPEATAINAAATATAPPLPPRSSLDSMPRNRHRRAPHAAPAPSKNERPVEAQCGARRGWRHGGWMAGPRSGMVSCARRTSTAAPPPPPPPPSPRKEIRTDSRAETACQESVSEIITVPSSDGRRSRSLVVASVLGRKLIGLGAVRRSRSLGGWEGRLRTCIREKVPEP